MSAVVGGIIITQRFWGHFAGHKLLSACFYCVFRTGQVLNGINQLIFVMVKCGVLFEVRTEFLNNI
jgi:hypothetical protein